MSERDGREQHDGEHGGFEHGGSEADWLEQQRPVVDADPDLSTGDDPPPAVPSVDADEADVLEQSREVPDDDEDSRTH